MNVPKMPEMKFTKDGKPDFSHLEDNNETLRDQLQASVSQSFELNAENGDRVVVREIYPDDFIYELMEDDNATFFKRKYTLQNGKPVVDDSAEQISSERYCVLSRRRLPKQGVPDPADADKES